MKKLTTLFLALLLSLGTFAQSRKYMSQFSHLQGYFNPALTAYEGSMVKGLVRNQWAGWEGAPKSYFVSAELDFANLGGDSDLGKNAVGVNLLNDEYGAFTESELQAAYVRNKEQFQLGVDIVQVSYLAVPATAPWSSKLRNALSRGDQNPPENLVLFAKKWARQYRLADTGWVELPDLAKQLGLPAYQPEALLRLGYKDWTSGSTRYLLQIHALKRASTTVPFPLARPWVKALLLERRKKEYWKRLESEMLEKH